jgi:hypothetical protein
MNETYRPDPLMKEATTLISGEASLEKPHSIAE